MPVTIVASSGSPTGRARLAAFNDPSGFSVIIRGLERGMVEEQEIRVKSVKRGLDVEADWAELSRIVIEEAEFVISNTTESGLVLPHDLRIDFGQAAAQPPPGYPAKLLALLWARFADDQPGVTLLPTELVTRNGDVLKRALIELAERSEAPKAFVSWVEEECIFANSLVDRIVSASIEPAGAVAEPYALWAIEAQPRLTLPCQHPAVQIVDDLEPVARLKLHILNLGHTVLAETWRRQGLAKDTTVRGMLADPAIRATLMILYADEVVPGFSARGLGDEAAEYATSTLDRFDNPFLDHLITDIANGHPQKMVRRVGDFIRWVDEAGGPPLPRLARLAALNSEEMAV